MSDRLISAVVRQWEAHPQDTRTLRTLVDGQDGIEQLAAVPYGVAFVDGGTPKLVPWSNVLELVPQRPF